jgi:hypothetical protein
MKAKWIALVALVPGLAGPPCAAEHRAPTPGVECCHV